MNDVVLSDDGRCRVTRVFSAAGFSDVTTWAPGCEPSDPVMVPMDPVTVAEARAAVDEATPAPIVALLDSLP